jgi:hypothetical protein
MSSILEQAWLERDKKELIELVERLINDAYQMGKRDVWAEIKAQQKAILEVEEKQAR